MEQLWLSSLHTLPEMWLPQPSCELVHSEVSSYFIIPGFSDDFLVLNTHWLYSPWFIWYPTAMGFFFLPKHSSASFLNTNFLFQFVLPILSETPLPLPHFSLAYPPTIPKALSSARSLFSMLHAYLQLCIEHLTYMCYRHVKLRCRSDWDAPDLSFPLYSLFWLVINHYFCIFLA
jgi:hypothetical protein